MTEHMDPRVGMLSRAQTIDALLEIDEATNKQGIQVALCGGVAMQVYGSDRLTADIDVLVTRPPYAFQQGAMLGFGGSSATTSAVPWRSNTWGTRVAKISGKPG